MTPYRALCAAALALCATAALSACQTRIEYRDRVVTKEVLVPTFTPCPDPVLIPIKPARVAEDHPVMPDDGATRERILGAKVAELQAYAEQAHPIMQECSRPR